MYYYYFFFFYLWLLHTYVLVFLSSSKAFRSVLGLTPCRFLLTA